MNKQLQEELKIRRWITNILTEEIVSQDQDLMIERLLTEQRFIAAPEDMWNTFVAPFTDVLKAASVGGKEILSAAKLTFDVLTSIRPSTIAKAKARYDKRSEKLSAEWGKVMATTDHALEGDAKLISFLTAPHLTLGMMFGDDVLRAPGGVVQYLEDAGWHIPLVGDVLGIDKDARIESEKEERDKAAATPLLNKIAGFFFMAHHEPQGPLLAEQAKEGEKEGEKEEAKGKGNSPSEIIDYLEKVGLKDKIVQDAKDMIEAKKEQVDELMKPFEAQVKLLDEIYNSKDLKSLASALQGAQQAGVDLDSAGLSNFEQQVNSQVDEILKDEEARAGFVKSYLEAQGKKVEEAEGEQSANEEMPEVTDEQLKPEIEKVVFMSSTQGMQEQIFTGVQNMKEQMKEEIKSGMPEGDDAKMLQRTELGKAYLSVVNDAIKKIDAV